MSMRDERLRSQRIENIKSVRPYNPVQEVARTRHVLVTGTRFGAFEVLERLGAGGMGEVYRAGDTRLDRTVALKIIRASELPTRDRLERFRREARAVSRLNHPNICALYDVGEDEGATFLVMEYVTAETLANRLERGPLRIEEVLRYGVQIAEARDAAHRSGVVHRDLKPSNIMLSQSGVKLLDFGIAKLRDIDAERIGDATTMSLGLSDTGSFLERCRTWRPCSSKESLWMRVLTSSRWARCSTRWRPVNRRFEGAARQA
jgi:serine/threonine protein kinase